MFDRDKDGHLTYEEVLLFVKAEVRFEHQALHTRE